jgi:hypothetical protein
MVTFSPEFQTFLDLAGAEVVDSLPFDQKGVVLRIAEITWTVAHNQNDNYGYSLARNEYGTYATLISGRSKRSSR